MIDVLDEFKGRGLEILPAAEVVWCEALESATQSWTEVGAGWRRNKCGLLVQWVLLLTGH
jgi:hypothetical protein